MTTVIAPAQDAAAEWPRAALRFRHEDLFQEPAYADGEPYDQHDEDNASEG